MEKVQKELADALFRSVPAAVGSTSGIKLGAKEMDSMLRGGARWAVAEGYGTKADLEHIEEGGAVEGASPQEVSDRAKARQREEMGTLGSGNHYNDDGLLEYFPPQDNRSELAGFERLKDWLARARTGFGP